VEKVKILSIGLLACLLALPAFADEKKPKAAEADPVVVFGMVDQNVGCVIFKEYIQKKVAALEVLETQNYDIQKKKWIEDADGSGDLVNLAIKDKIKFVKIPEKYTPEQLEKARAACKESAPGPAPEKTGAQ
jgi:hypothetical protein